MIKEPVAPDHFNVEEFVKNLLCICCGMPDCKSLWQAVKFDGSKQIGGREAKAVGIRFQRVKPRYVPKNWFDKMHQRLISALEPAIEIEPLYVHARHHKVVAKVVIGGRKFSRPVELLLLYPFRNDIKMILAGIKRVTPAPKI